MTHPLEPIRHSKHLHINQSVDSHFSEQLLQKLLPENTSTETSPRKPVAHALEPSPTVNLLAVHPPPCQRQFTWERSHRAPHHVVVHIIRHFLQLDPQPRLFGPRENNVPCHITRHPPHSTNWHQLALHSEAKSYP